MLSGCYLALPPLSAREDSMGGTDLAEAQVGCCRCASCLAGRARDRTKLAGY
jgi:hypothetical protein